MRSVFTKLSLMLAMSLLAACSTASDPVLPASPASGPTKVINSGVSGNTSGQLLARLDRDVLSMKPDVVVIMVGTNDRLNSHSFADAAVYRRNLDTLVSRILAKRIGVVLVTPPTCIEAFLFTRHDPKLFAKQSPKQRMEEVRRIVLDIARKKDTGLVDFHHYLVRNKLADQRRTSLLRNPANSGAKDGVHLTPEGSRRLAELVSDELKRNSMDSGTIICFGDSITLGSGPENYPRYLEEILSR